MDFSSSVSIGIALIGLVGWIMASGSQKSLAEARVPVPVRHQKF